MSKRKGLKGLKNPETVSLKTFLSWDFHEDFLYEVDEQNKVVKLQCKICSEHISSIRHQAKLRGISGQSLQSLINYVDGVRYVHKANVTRHVKSGSLHSWAKQQYMKTGSESASTSTTTPSPTGYTTTTGTSPLTPAPVQQLLLKGATEQYKHHLMTALTIVLNESPMSDFETMIDLQKKNGVTFISGKCNKMACREMIQCLATSIRKDIGNILANCSFIACEQDGSEARKTRDEKELVYAKVVIRGKPQELLLKCQRMTKFGGVSAEHIKQAIDDAFNAYNLPEGKYHKCLVSACADGASVNLGRLKGALTVLKVERPWLLIIHCSAHRIELAVRDAFKESPEFQRIDDMMLNLYCFFRNSGKCWRILLLLAEKLGVLLQRFPKSAGTRFQVHKYRALKVLIVNFLPLCMFAENMIESSNKACDPQQKAKLRGYYNQWLSYQYLASLHLYRLVLRETAHLSYVCQQSTKLVTEVVETLNSASEGLLSVAEETQHLPFPVQAEGESVTITAEVTNLPSNQKFRDKNQLTQKQRAKAEKCTKVIRESYDIKKVSQGKEAVKRIKEKLIPAISSHLTDRMKSFDEHVFSAMKIADHSNWDYEVKDYGIEEVKVLAKHFDDSLKFHNFSLDLALVEWKSLKNLVKTKYKHFTNKVALWQQVFIHYQAKHPHILLLIEIILITPYSSASVERGFSLLNRLLSNTRLNLSSDTLDDIMVLRVNVPILISCDPDYELKLVQKASELYITSKHRRVFSKCEKRPSSTTVDELRSSTDTFLPVPVSSLLTCAANDLISDEEFLTYRDGIDSDMDSDYLVPSSSSDSESETESHSDIGNMDSIMIQD